MRLFILLAFSIFSFLTTYGIAQTPSTSSPDKQIEQLIARLKDPDYAVREWAESYLAALGAKAQSQLEAASEEASFEARQRIARLLAPLHDRQAQARLRAVEDRLRAFANDQEAAGTPPLPGWAAFQQIVGDNPASRELFCEMQRHAGTLLAVYETDLAQLPKACLKHQAEKAYHARMLRKIGLEGQNGAGPGELAARLLIAGDERVNLSEFEQTQLLGAFGFGITNSIGAADGEASLYLKKLLLRWLDRPLDPAMSAKELPAADPLKMFVNGSSNPEMAARFLLATKIQICQQLEYFDPLYRIISDRKQAATRRIEALKSLVNVQGSRNQEVIESLLNDTTPYQDKDKSQVRDLALAILVHLTDQSPTEYGFAEDLKNAFQMFWFVAGDFSLGDFPSRRDQALAKWRVWSKQNRDFKARLDAFVHDVGGIKDHGLPGWAHFRKVTGDTRQTRELFIQMQQAVPDLLTAYQQGGRTAESAFQDFWKSKKSGQFLTIRFDGKHGEGMAGALLLIVGDEQIPLPLWCVLGLDNLMQGSFNANWIQASLHRESLLKLRKHLRLRLGNLEKEQEAFVKDLETGSKLLTFPGWEQFRAITGDNAISRRLFVLMRRCEPELLAAYQEGPEQAAQSLIARCQYYGDENNRNLLSPGNDTIGNDNPLSNGTLAALWFVGADERVSIPQEILLELCRFAVYQEGVQEWKFNHNSYPAGSKLLAQVLNRFTPKQVDKSLPKILQVVQQNSLRDCLPLLIAVARNPETAAPERVMALLNVGKLGDQKNISDIEPLLNDLATLNSFDSIGPIPLGDFALAVLVHLSRQPMQNYGFGRHLPIQTLIQSPPAQMDLKLGEGREAAIAKWRAWSQAEEGLGARLAAFNADADGSQNISLPGWNAFRQIMGHDSTARALFVAMQREERTLLEEYENQPEDAKRALEVIRSRRQTQPPSLESVATYLLVAGDERIVLAESPFGQLVSQWSDVLNNEENRAKLRPLLTRWLGRTSDVTGGWGSSEKLKLAQQFGFTREARAIAIRALEKIQAAPQATRGQPKNFLPTLGMLGDPTCLAVVEPFLEDKTGAQPAFRGRPELLMCDIALAALIQMTGQSWANYGLKTEDDIPVGPATQWQLETFRFDSPNDREKAIAEWHAWSERKKLEQRNAK